MMILDWINRYRVRVMDADTALEGLIFFTVAVVVVILIKWMFKSERRY